MDTEPSFPQSDYERVKKMKENKTKINDERMRHKLKETEDELISEKAARMIDHDESTAKVKIMEAELSKHEQSMKMKTKEMKSKEEMMRTELEDALSVERTARQLEHEDLNTKVKILETELREQKAKMTSKEKNEEEMNIKLSEVNAELTLQKTVGELEHKDLTAKIKELKTKLSEQETNILLKKENEERMRVDFQKVKDEVSSQGKARELEHKDLTAYITELETKLRSEYETVKKKDTTIKELERKLLDVERKLDSQKTANVELVEKQMTVQQLSRLAGALLTSNNPNLADLSDTNRPTKLAEKYSELYDNEWTDAYEALSESSVTDEQTRINELLDISKASYDECVQLSKPFRNTLESLTTVTLRVKGDQECHNRDEIKQDQETITTDVDKSLQTSFDHVGPGALTAGKNDDNHEEARAEEKMETDALENQASPQIDVQPTFSDKDPENVENQVDEAMEVGSEGQNTSNKDDNNVKTNDNLSCEKKQGQGSTGSPKTEAATGDEHSLGNHTTDGAVPHVDGSPSPVSQVDEGLDPLQGQRTEQNLEHREPIDNQEYPEISGRRNMDNEQYMANNETQERNTDESSKTEAAIENKHSLQNHNTDGAVSPVDDTTLLVSQATGKTGKTNLPPGFSSNVHTGEITAEVKVEVEFTAELRKNVSDMKRMCGRKLEEEMGLSKAIAQKIALERNIDAEKHERIIAYITKCAELCWFMMIQEPPVFIGFNDVKTGEPFNKDVYKAYTKTGKQLDYIVWPPLYLHKGGPMLSKGVAQGAN